MSRSTKAVLLSALVLPGLGQLYLKHPWRGFILIALSLVCLGIIVNGAMQQAAVVLTQLESGAITPDVDQINTLLNQASSPTDSSAVTLATWGLAVGWLAGVIDAYRLGKQQDAQKAG